VHRDRRRRHAARLAPRALPVIVARKATGEEGGGEARADARSPLAVRGTSPHLKGSPAVFEGGRLAWRAWGT
jgi:hypothetical protein